MAKKPDAKRSRTADALPHDLIVEAAKVAGQVGKTAITVATGSVAGEVTRRAFTKRDQKKNNPGAEKKVILTDRV